MFSLKGAITNLGKYNEGELVYEWIEFPIYEDELEEVFEKIGVGEEYEEYFFSDWDCDFGLGLNFGEYENINRVNEIAEFYCELDMNNTIDVFNAIYEEIEDFESAVETYKKNNYIYYGYVDFSELAKSLATERIQCLECSNDVKDFISDNFNYNSYENELSYYIKKTSYGVVEILY